MIGIGKKAFPRGVPIVDGDEVVIAGPGEIQLEYAMAKGVVVRQGLEGIEVASAEIPTTGMCNQDGGVTLWRHGGPLASWRWRQFH